MLQPQIFTRTRPFGAAKVPTRKRGQAQREVVRFIVEYKQTHNGFSPSYTQIAAHMGYSHAMSAHNVVSGIVNKNRPSRPYLIDTGDYGQVWIDVDDDGRIIVPEGQFVLTS